jgi:hypothetical protein
MQGRWTCGRCSAAPNPARRWIPTVLYKGDLLALNKRERDASLERLLRHAMQDDARAASPCLDAETIAAWSEGALPDPMRTAAEAHAASCLRCQAVLASMARTAAADLRAPAHSALSRSIRWLVPFAAVSAITAVVISIWPAARPSLELQEKASPAVPAEVAPEPAPPPATPAPTPKVGAAPSSSADELRETDALTARKDRSKADEKVAADSGRRADLLRDRDVAGRAAVPPESELQKQSGIQSAPANRIGGAAAATPSPPAPPATLAPQRVESVPLQQSQGSSQSASQQSAQVQARAPGAPAAAADRRESAAFQLETALPVVIATPVSVTMWRILNGRDVQRSDDGGATWTTQTTVADAHLAAGSCPTITVCWIVGAAGTVLRTTDGRTWQRTLFVDAVELAAVRAADALNAVVTTRDGRTFFTADGGRNWSRQETPR